jgi:Leucine-rich repeat (LRR) protein
VEKQYEYILGLRALRVLLYIVFAHIIICHVLYTAHLEIEETWLTGSPHFLADMPSLEYVYLRSNSLFGHLNFLKLGKLTNLIEVWLDHNKIESDIPTQVTHLRSLKAFSCINTTLTGPIPSELGALPHLNRIWLSNNQLTGTVPVELANLTKLEVFDIHNNEIDGEMPTGVCDRIAASTYPHKALEADCDEVTCKTPACCTKCF